MICLGLKPREAGWMVQTNPLSYGGTRILIMFCFYLKNNFWKFWAIFPRLSGHTNYYEER